jgi:hypothetical protein
LPRAIQHLRKLCFTISNVTSHDRLDAWHDAWVLHHESHKFAGVSANATKFEAVLQDKVLEDWMCAYPHAVAVWWLLQCLTESDEWLYVPTRSGDQNRGIHARLPSQFINRGDEIFLARSNRFSFASFPKLWFALTVAVNSRCSLVSMPDGLSSSMLESDVDSTVVCGMRAGSQELFVMLLYLDRSSPHCDSNVSSLALPGEMR